MHINPYGEYAVQLGVELCNVPPASPEELGSRCSAAGLVVDTVPTEEDLRDTTAFLDDLLARASTYPRLTDHAGDGWHMHYRDPNIALGSVVRALVSVGTALHLTGRGMDRLGRCAAADCDAVFADVSRTGRQRYCGTVCSNRDAVRRHRARAAVGRSR